MWSESDGERESQEVQKMGRSSNSSELAMTDSRIIAAATRDLPTIANLNVSTFSRMHLGPKFITQNVHSTQVLKDLPLPKYLWSLLKSTTRVERLLCAAAISALILCISLTVYFTLMTKGNNAVVDVAPHEWNITREMWLAQPANNTQKTKPYEPLRLVIVQHTVSPDCNSFIACASEIRNLQLYSLHVRGYDLGYNFLIGNDGRVYEVRGWGVVGAHTYGYNSCTIGIGFIGDYRDELPAHSEVTNKQIKRTKMLLDVAVQLGYLHPEYHIIGAKDVQASESPGSNLYNEIRTWPHYDHEHRYKNKNCTQIQAMYKQ